MERERDQVGERIVGRVDLILQRFFWLGSDHFFDGEVGFGLFAFSPLLREGGRCDG
jgi:hypothetical protein